MFSILCALAVTSNNDIPNVVLSLSTRIIIWDRQSCLYHNDHRLSAGQLLYWYNIEQHYQRARDSHAWLPLIYRYLSESLHQYRRFVQSQGRFSFGVVMWSGVRGALVLKIMVRHDLPGAEAHPHRCAAGEPVPRKLTAKPVCSPVSQPVYHAYQMTCLFALASKEANCPM